MKVLVTSTPGAGHVMPLLPVAAALRSAGHEVLWATGPDGTALVRAAGLEAVPAGLDQATRMRRFAEGWPTMWDVSPRDRRLITYPVLFAALAARPMYEDLLRVAEQIRPAVIVHEPCELAAAPLARRLDLPNACVGAGRFIPRPLLRAAADDVYELWNAAGALPPSDLGLYGHAYFHPLPARMEPAPARSGVHPLRPMVAAPHAKRRRTPGRQLSVYVTFGTEFGSMAPWRSVIDALAGLDVDAVLTTGTVDPDDLGVLPPGVRAERWIPQPQALAGADLMVSHGGSGALLGAATAGIPHLVLPMGADHFDNADLVASCRLGAAIERDDLSAGTIAAAISRLLGDDHVRHAVQRASDDLAAMPGAEHAAQRILDLGTA